MGLVLCLHYGWGAWLGDCVILLWYPALSPEIAWFILPINSALWMAGGTWNKLFRRIGYPLCISLLGLLFSRYSWWWALSSLAAYGVATLPTTLIGSDVTSSIWNRVWVFIWGIALTLPSLLVSRLILPCLIFGLFIGLLVTLSNWKPTARYFPWKMVEFFVGSLVMIPYCLAV